MDENSITVVGLHLTEGESRQKRFGYRLEDITGLV